MGDWLLMEMMENIKPKVEPVAEAAQAVETKWLGSHISGDAVVKYYTTPNAKTYHTRDCFTIRNASELLEMTAEEAENSGRKACGNCLGS